MELKHHGFTLAEVLITLAVVGVVSAITLPTVVTSLTERANSEKEANTVQKVTQAMDLMRANGKLTDKYADTDAFVDELQKYLKIAKRCSATELTKCWPTEKVINEANEEYEVRYAIIGKNINRPNNKTRNVGLILANGVPIILSYYENSEPINETDPVTAYNKSLPIGFGKSKDFVYSSSVTAPIAFVMDVNGKSGPNSEKLNGKTHDIRSFNGAKFSDGCPGEVMGSYGCVYYMGTSYSPISCANGDNAEYCGNSPSGLEKDYWAGANKACQDIGMKMPTSWRIYEICLYNKNNNIGYFPESGAVFSNDESDIGAWVNSFPGGGNWRGGNKSISTYGVMCQK